MVSAASGPYPVEARASRPSTGTPVTTVSSCLCASEEASGRPRMMSRHDMGADVTRSKLAARSDSCHARCIAEGPKEWTMAKLVRDIMKTEPIRLQGATPVIEAARRMYDANVGAVIVAD